MTDQAEGLRRLFAGEMRRLVAFVGSDAALSAFSARLAENLAAHGQRVLLLDESLSRGERHLHLGVTPAEDLDAVLAGEMEIDAAICPLAPHWHLLAGGGTDMARRRPRPEARIALVNAFYRLAGAYDVVLVDARGQDIHQRPSFAWTCQDVVVVCDETPDAITAAYARIKMLQQPERRFHVLFCGGEAPRMSQRFRHLAGVCRRHLRMMPQYLGAIAHDEAGSAALQALTEKVLCWPLPPQKAGYFPMLMRRLLRPAVPHPQLAAR